MRDPESRAESSSSSRDSAFSSSQQMKGGENAKTKQQSKTLAQALHFGKCLSSVTKVVLVRQEQSAGLSVSTAASPHLHTITQQLPGLKSSAPTCPRLVHWPPKAQK